MKKEEITEILEEFLDYIAADYYRPGEQPWAEHYVAYRFVREKLEKNIK